MEYKAVTLYNQKIKRGRDGEGEREKHSTRELKNPTMTDGLCHFEYSLPKEQTLVEAIKASVGMRIRYFNIDNDIYVTSKENNVIEIYP